MNDEPQPDRVWVLLMWDMPKGAPRPAPNDPQDWPGEGPVRTGGTLMGVYATKAAALKELEAECGPQEMAERHWVQPGPDPNWLEFRGARPAEGWFELRYEPILSRSRFGDD